MPKLPPAVVALACLTWGCAKASSPEAAFGMHDTTVVLEGSSGQAEADAEVLQTRLTRWGYPGSARAEGDTIVVTLPMPAGVSPNRIVERLLAPGQVSIHPEVAANAHAGQATDCTAGPDDCEPVAIGPAHVTTEHVREVTPLTDPSGNQGLLLEFTEEGADRMAQASTELLGQRMVVQVDGRVLSRPTIRQPVRDGTAVIHLAGGLHGQRLVDAAEVAELMRGPALAGTWTVRTAE